MFEETECSDTTKDLTGGYVTTNIHHKEHQTSPSRAGTPTTVSKPRVLFYLHTPNSNAADTLSIPTYRGVRKKINRRFDELAMQVISELRLHIGSSVRCSEARVRAKLVKAS